MRARSARVAPPCPKLGSLGLWTDSGLQSKFSPKAKRFFKRLQAANDAERVTLESWSDVKFDVKRREERIALLKKAHQNSMKNSTI